jgi:hypothetical protein
MYLIFSGVIAFFTFKYVNMIELKSVIGTLQNIAAAVFTLAGIWIAYSYPQAIAAYTNPDKVSIIKGTEETQRIEKLVLIILTSAFVIISILFYHLSSILLKNAPLIMENKNIFKYLSVMLLIYLSINQTKAILTVMISNIEFVNELYKKKTEKEADEDL